MLTIMQLGVGFLLGLGVPFFFSSYDNTVIYKIYFLLRIHAVLNKAILVIKNGIRIKHTPEVIVLRDIHNASCFALKWRKRA